MPKRDGFQGPTTGKKGTTISQLMGIVQHPAFRIGFLDAQNGHPLDHDSIMNRIEAETKSTALRRIGWNAFLGGNKAIELAQYRYEEGRIAVKEFGCACKAWGHPDYPPAQVVRLCEKLAQDRKKEELSPLP